jgi:hypothetical protein
MRWLLAILLFVFGLGTAAAQQCPPGTWRHAAPLPQNRTEVTGASDGHSVFIVGGMATDPATDLLAVLRYDPAANSWSTIGRLDGTLNHWRGGAGRQALCDRRL